MTEIVIKEPTKISGNTLAVTKDVIGLRCTFTHEFLVQQRATILADIAKYTADRNLELDEIDTLLAECTKLGIKSTAEVVEIP